MTGMRGAGQAHKNRPSFKRTEGHRTTHARRARRRDYRNFRKPISSAKSEKQLRRGANGARAPWEIGRGRAHTPADMAEGATPPPTLPRPPRTRARDDACTHRRHSIILYLRMRPCPLPQRRLRRGGGGRREAVAADGGHGVARAARSPRSACTHQVREPGPYVCGCVPWMPGPGMLVRAADAGGAGKGGEGWQQQDGAPARRRKRRQCSIKMNNEDGSDGKTCGHNTDAHGSEKRGRHSHRRSVRSARTLLRRKWETKTKKLRKCFVLSKPCSLSLVLRLRVCRSVLRARGPVGSGGGPSYNFVRPRHAFLLTAFDFIGTLSADTLASVSLRNGEPAADGL